MALSPDSLKYRLAQSLEAKGFRLDNEHARTMDLLEAIAQSVVDELQQNARVTVPSGSSSGIYKVQ